MSELKQWKIDMFVNNHPPRKKQGSISSRNNQFNEKTVQIFLLQLDQCANSDFFHCTKNITQRIRVHNWSETYALYAVIHLMQEAICRNSQEIWIMTKMLCLMKHQVLGISWTCVSSHKQRWRRTPRNNPQRKMTITILGLKALPLQLGKCKKR